MKKISALLQKLGKALMLPIAILPVAGLLMRLGQPDLLNIPILAKSGSVLFDNLPLLFAIGIAVGLAKDNNGAAGLAGAVSYFVLNASAQAANYALQAHTIFAIENTGDLKEIQLLHFGGIIAGVIAGLAYNRFYKTKLPDILSFFGGRRLVPIMTGLFSLLIGILLGLIWPYFQNGLDAAANWMVLSGGVGAFIYGVLNRLLLPFGLHHVINTVVWFTFGTYTNPVTGEVSSGDITRFFQGDPTGGTFTAGFFPIMMFALPAAALAMYFCAKKGKRKEVGGALFSVALVALLTGITEPIEFMFMFLAPVLYGIHSIFMGISLVVCQLLGVHDSFTFSAGLFDYLLNWGLAQKPWLILIIGLIFAAVYFAVFTLFIRVFDIKTPGREDEDDAEQTGDKSTEKEKSDFALLAKEYLKALGGKENIQEIEACITRLRMVLKSNAHIDEKELKLLGASGVMKMGNQATQVIVGTKAEFLVDEIKKLL